MIVTGEHSGLANLLPGNPGVVDPPDLSFAEAETLERRRAHCAAGSYVYAVTDDFSPGGGQSIASESAPVTVTGSEGTVTLTLAGRLPCRGVQGLPRGVRQRRMEADRDDPRADAPRLRTAGLRPDHETAVTGGGALESDIHRHRRRRHAVVGTAGVSEAVESRLPPEPQPDPCLRGPRDPVLRLRCLQALPEPGHRREHGGGLSGGLRRSPTAAAQAIPRYPTNIYYNASTEAQEVDEFNTLYTPIAQGGKCVASATTTCETAPATFAEIVSDVDTNMFQHMMGNDPAAALLPPAEHHGLTACRAADDRDPPGDLAERRRRAVLLGDEPAARRVQQVLQRPDRTADDGADRTAARRAGGMERRRTPSQVSGYIEGNKVTINNTGAGAVSAPLTGVTGVGSSYGGIQSGWTSVPAGTSTHATPVNWPEVARVTTVSLPVASAHTAYSQTLTASGGATPYSWSLSSGSLPAGLALNTTTGAITGTPAAAGTSIFTVKFTDSSTPTPRTALASLSIAVLPDPPVLTGAAAASVAQTTVTLNATVNPNGGEVSTCEFEYGATNAYGLAAPCAVLPGSGSSPVAGRPRSRASPPTPPTTSESRRPTRAARAEEATNPSSPSRSRRPRSPRSASPQVRLAGVPRSRSRAPATCRERPSRSAATRAPWKSSRKPKSGPAPPRRKPAPTKSSSKTKKALGGRPQLHLHSRADSGKHHAQ